MSAKPKEIVTSTQFRKDLKRYRNEPKKIEHLIKVVNQLRTEERLPSKYKVHILNGEYKGYLECHIENDVLLVWKSSEVIYLARLGSHSEIFR